MSVQNKEARLIKNTAIIAVGKICTQFISFFLLPLYTSFLSTEEYGVVDLLNTYVALLIPIFFFQLDQAVFRFLIDARENPRQKMSIISNSVFASGIQAAVYLLFCLLISPFQKNDYMIFLAANVVLSVGANILLQIARGLGDNVSYSVGSLITGSSTVVLNVVFVAFLRLGAVGMLTATMIGNFLCILYIFLRKKIYSHIKLQSFSRETIAALCRYSLPLVPNQLSWWTVNTSDRLIIRWILGFGANGIYSAANKFSAIVITVFTIFNLTWAESASLHIKDDDKDEFFTKIFNTTLRLFVALSFGIVATMPFVFQKLITGAGYAPAYEQIPILLLSTIFNIVVALLGSVYVALKKTGEIAKTSVVAAVINIAVNVLLIRFIGLYAASISTVVAYFAMAIYRYIDVQKYVKVKIELPFVFSSILVGGVIYAIYYIRNLYLCAAGFLLACVFALIMNRELLREAVEFVKRRRSWGKNL